MTAERIKEQEDRRRKQTRNKQLWSCVGRYGWGALGCTRMITYGEDGVAAVAVHVAELLGGGRREVVQREGGRRRRGRHHDFDRPNECSLHLARGGCR
jgi:hypothetical protein